MKIRSFLYPQDFGVKIENPLTNRRGQKQNKKTSLIQCRLVYLSCGHFSISASAFFSISFKNLHCLYSKLGKSINVRTLRGRERPPVSHRLSQTPAQPSIWNSPCPVKGTEQPAQACSCLSVHASPRQPSSVCGQQLKHTHASTRTHIHKQTNTHQHRRVIEHRAADMTFKALRWTYCCES